MADGSGYHSSTAAPDWVPTAARDWASLERGILEQISRRLPVDADRVRVGHVCRHWRSAVSGDRGVMGRPWILARRGRGWWLSYAFLRLSSSHQDVDTFSVGATIPPAVDVLGASRGWLAVRHGDRVILTDLISPAAKVSLPPFLLGYRVKNVFLSGDPFTAPEWRAFAIAAAANGQNDALASCRQGDTSWTLIDGDAHPARRYSSIEFHGGRVYAVDDIYKRMICVDGTAVTSQTWIPSHSRDGGNSMAWLVECAGDLLLVRLEHALARRRCGARCVTLNHRRVGYDGYLGLFFLVCKLKFTEDGVPESYSTVRDIGDHALFLGESGHAFAVQASASGLAGVRSNFLYYVGHMEQRMVAFDVDAYQYVATPYSRRGVSVLGRWEPFCWFCPRRPVIRT